MDDVRWDNCSAIQAPWAPGRWVLYSKGKLWPEPPGKDNLLWFLGELIYVQVGNTPSNLRIVDYAHGNTGATHDALAFEATCAFRFPQFLFKGEEFAWGDSAYALSPYMMPVHKKPAADIYENTKYDKAVAHIRIRSEHCMGALKGHWQCLRGLQAEINGDKDHVKACQWITICIILHNLIIDVEGSASAAAFQNLHGQAEEEEDSPELDFADLYGADGSDDHTGGEEKRKRLVQQVMAHRADLGI